MREHGPDAPMADFAKGRLGVVQPDWYTAYQVVAFRYLQGKPLSALEQRSLLDHYDTDRRVEPPDTTLQAMEAWVSARSPYLPAPPGSDLSVFKQSLSTFYEIPNCLAPAFNMAVTTLHDRARRFGSSSPDLQEWIRGQDAVFRNCRGAATIPPELPAAANPLLRADRAYQIAAAHFYASPSPAGGTGNGYETTLKDFQAIAADPSSPWHNLASYLIARTLIREASATAPPNRTYNSALLAKAETQLQSILKDPSQQSVHDDARTLLGLVEYRLHPDQRKAELAKALAEGAGVHFGQDLVDYVWLGRRPNQPAQDDLSKWIEERGPVDKLLKEWRATRSVPWLIAVLWQVEPDNPAFNEVMEAAAKVPPKSAAYPTVAYYRAQFARESGDSQLARQVLQAALAQRESLPPSALHLFQDEQMQVAADFASFQSVVWQQPQAHAYLDLESCENADSVACGPQFSPTAATLLNTRIPSEIFARVAQSVSLPASLRRRMAPAAWARAALLDETAIAKQMAEPAAVAEPALKPYLEEYAKAQNRDDRQFAAVFAILHFPGMRPYVDGPYPRATAFEFIDDYRDNWWTADVGGDVTDVNYAKSEPATGPNSAQVSSPAFLSAEEKQRAATEWHELHALGSASHYLPRMVLDRGKKHPKDPRVPEALYLAVRAMRYGTSNDLSQDCYNMLHQNYPASEWTRQTPYWYTRQQESARIAGALD